MARKESERPDQANNTSDEAVEANKRNTLDGQQPRVDPMEQPTPSRMGTAAHAILDHDDKPSETRRAAERATRLRRR